MRGPIQSLEVTFHAHATEDTARLERAVSSLLGTEVPPEEEVLEGHFGNRIIAVRYHLTGQEAGSAFSRVVGSLSDSLRRTVSLELLSLVDEHQALYLRLEKQGLLTGDLSFSQSDSIRIRVKPRPYAIGGNVMAFYRHSLEGRGFGP